MLYPLFEWFELTMVGEIIRSSTWLFPFIEAFHLLAFAVLGGAVLLVDLRLIGLAFRSQPVAHVAREIQPWAAKPRGRSRFRKLALPLRIREVLLQRAVLDQDHGSLLRAHLHLHDPPQSDDGGGREHRPHLGPGRWDGFDRALGDRRLGRTLDRLFRLAPASGGCWAFSFATAPSDRRRPAVRPCPTNPRRASGHPGTSRCARWPD